jgi:hypothetical protein
MTRTAVVLALAVAASGCGGGHKKAAPPWRTPAPTPAAAAEKTPAPEHAEDCRQLLSLRSQVEQALLSGRIDPRMPRSLTPLAANAPAEIRPDARKVAVAYGQVQRALKRGESLTVVLSRLDTAGLTAATERINRWAAANC